MQKKLYKLVFRYLKLSLIFIFFSACTCYTHLITAEYNRPIVPILVGKAENETLSIQFIRNDSTEYRLEKLAFSLQGSTDMGIIESATLTFRTKNSLSTYNETKSITGDKITFAPQVAINQDTLLVSLHLKLHNDVELSHRIMVKCQRIITSAGNLKLQPDQEAPLRIGIAVRQSRQDGIHTTRIPGLTTSKRGTLLAVFDARWDSSRDLQGDIDIGLHRSRDGGKSWLPLQIVLDQKKWGGLPEKFNGVSDASILVDENSGRIFVAGLWMHGILNKNSGRWIEGLTEESNNWIHQWVAKGSQPGIGIKETSQFLITYSDDDGQTWSEPQNITAQTKRKEWWLFAPAPGHGITLRDGTLVFPTQGRDANGLPFSNITYSKDGGKSWTTSNLAYSDVTECMAIELLDGSIMLNMRDNRNRNKEAQNGRRVCITRDLGETWSEHASSGHALIEPVCMGSLHRHHYTQNGIEQNILLFMNPHSTSRRNHMTLQVSFDEGTTWPQEHHIEIDEFDSFGYSCITSINQSTIGVIYEGSRAQLVFQQIPLSEILKTDSKKTIKMRL